MERNIGHYGQFPLRKTLPPELSVVALDTNVFRALCYEKSSWLATFERMAADGYAFCLADAALAEPTNQFARGSFTADQLRRAVTAFAGCRLLVARCIAPVARGLGSPTPKPTAVGIGHWQPTQRHRPPASNHGQIAAGDQLAATATSDRQPASSHRQPATSNQPEATGNQPQTIARVINTRYHDNMIRTQISVGEELYRRAKVVARRNGISLAELCRLGLSGASAYLGDMQGPGRLIVGNSRGLGDFRGSMIFS